MPVKFLTKPVFLLTFIFFVVNLFIINDYGVTWDYSYHSNAGLWHLGRNIQPGFVMGPSPPLSDVIPVLFRILFHDTLNVLPWDSAYNLYSVLAGTLGIAVIYLSGRDLIGKKTGLIAAIILGLTPRYFGHLHNNMKDIPQAVFFTLSMFTFFKFIRKPTFKRLIPAVISFAIAYNSKVNALFVPVIATLYTAYMEISFKGRLFKFNPIKIKFLVLYLVAGPLAALLIWWPFWNDPWARLAEAAHSYTTSTTNMPVLYFGNVFYSGQNIPWHYPFGIILATTPILVTMFFIIGTGICFIRGIRKNYAAIFLIFWFIIPVLRYFKPHMVVIDDIRHFMELVFPFTLIAAIGFTEFYKFAGKGILRIALPVLFLIYLIRPIVTYHPYQTIYFSEITGGIKGAEGRFDIDFWAYSYKQIMEYINKEAPKSGKVTVAMAPDIAELYARSDLKEGINKLNLAGTDPSVYGKSDMTLILNRQSFFNWYSIYAYMQNRKPLYSIELNGVPLSSVYLNQE